MKTNNLLWHYSKGIHFESIIIDGFLKHSTAFIGPNEKPIVWFSSNQKWEPTVMPMATAMAEIFKIAGGITRFGIYQDDTIHHWKDLKTTSGMEKRVIKGLVKSAKMMCAYPNHWYGSYDIVPRDKWVAIDVWEPDCNDWERVYSAI